MNSNADLGGSEDSCLRALSQELEDCKRELAEARMNMARLEARATERLRRSEAFSAEAQRLSHSGSFGFNALTGESIWSEETYLIFGYSPGQRITLDMVYDRVHPEDIEFVRAEIENSIRESRDANFEHRLLMPSGEIKYVQVFSRAMGATGAEPEFVGVVMDTTERKQTAEALRLSEDVARRQLEAVATSLEALSRESEPDKFLEHVFRIACRQLGAVEASIWEMNDKAGCVDLSANYQGDVLRLPMNDEGQARPRIKSTMTKHPVWTEFFETGKRCVFGTIEPEPPWSLVANDQDGPWYDWRADLVDNPAVPQMHQEKNQQGIVATLNVPMFVGNKVTGLFVLCFTSKRRYREDEVRLASAMSYQAMLALQLMRLSRKSSEAAVIAERNRVARNIHDTLAQGFTGVIMQLEAARGAASQGDAAGVASRIGRASDLARSSLGEARRSVRALRPSPLLKASLPNALNELVTREGSDAGLDAKFACEGPPRALPPDWDEDLLRIAQEALTNTVRHAEASHFRANLLFLADSLELRLSDNGRGFDVTTEHEGFGLIGMRERVDRMNGRMSISSDPSVGTEIAVLVGKATSAGHVKP